MVVITLSECQASLRGDLTKWLLEINAGVFVGRISARVRNNLWERVCKSIPSGGDGGEIDAAAGEGNIELTEGYGMILEGA
jgi:CRISPR-associated endoribonuclease Cas2 subtype I-E